MKSRSSLGQASRYAPTDLVVIGKLGKTHGLRGEICCFPETDYPERFLETAEVELIEPGRSAIRVAIESARLHKNQVLLKFVGVQRIEDAESLRGWLVAVGPDEVIELGDGEYFHYELEGLEVVDEQERPLGILAEVLSNSAHEIYVVRGPQGDILIPAVDEFILDIDLDGRRIQVRPPVYAEDEN